MNDDGNGRNNARKKWYDWLNEHLKTILWRSLQNNKVKFPNLWFIYGNFQIYLWLRQRECIKVNLSFSIFSSTALLSITWKRCFVNNIEFEQAGIIPKYARLCEFSSENFSALAGHLYCLNSFTSIVTCPLSNWPHTWWENSLVIYEDNARQLLAEKGTDYCLSQLITDHPITTFFTVSSSLKFSFTTSSLWTGKFMVTCNPVLYLNREVFLAS